MQREEFLVESLSSGVAADAADDEIENANSLVVTAPITTKQVLTKLVCRCAVEIQILP